jgi:hypothetical protein
LGLLQRGIFKKRQGLGLLQRGIFKKRQGLGLLQRGIFKKRQGIFKVNAWSLARLNEAMNEKITPYFKENSPLP